MKDYCLKLIEKVDATNVKHYSKLLTEFEYQIHLLEQEEPTPKKCELYIIQKDILYNSISFIDKEIINLKVQEMIKNKDKVPPVNKVNISPHR